MKTIVRPSFVAFFNARPGLAFPVFDGLFVALQRSPRWALRTPVQLPQQLPDMPGVIPDPELFLDQVRYPITSPKRRLITQSLRPF